MKLRPGHVRICGRLERGDGVVVDAFEITVASPKRAGVRGVAGLTDRVDEGFERDRNERDAVVVLVPPNCSITVDVVGLLRRFQLICLGLGGANSQAGAYWSWDASLSCSMLPSRDPSRNMYGVIGSSWLFIILKDDQLSHSDRSSSVTIGANKINRAPKASKT